MDIYLQVAICFAAIGLSAVLRRKKHGFSFRAVLYCGGFCVWPECDRRSDGYARDIAARRDRRRVSAVFSGARVFAAHAAPAKARDACGGVRSTLASTSGWGLGLGMLLGLGVFSQRCAGRGHLYEQLGHHHQKPD